MSRTITLIILIIFVMSSLSAQTIGAKIKNLQYQNVNSIFEFKQLTCPPDYTDSLYCAFYNSKTREAMIYDRKNKLYLYPQYADTNTLVSFNIYSDKGVLIAYWAFISPSANFHFIDFSKKKRNKIKRKTITVGCMKGGKCNYHGLNEKLFNNLTMEKTQEEFNLMVKEIVKKGW